MEQSNLRKSGTGGAGPFPRRSHPLHVAILLDGNGRWAQARGLDRLFGHRAGLEAVRQVVASAPALGISTLSLFAFSSSNWQRPAEEVQGVLALLEKFLFGDAWHCAEAGVRISVLGRRDRLPDSLREAIAKAEQVTAKSDLLHLRIAVDYSAREAILRAACRMISSREISQAEFSRLLDVVTHSAERAPQVDLLIRTGGEQRLSDFLLWECAWAELHFSPRMWPDFTPEDLGAAVAEYHRRDRRFGAVRDLRTPPMRTFSESEKPAPGTRVA